ncbi:MAG: iron-sulfur cluster assembly scaffold protein [Methanoregula sp.]|jgi:nitrogen fixation NifU-like protein
MGEKTRYLYGSFHDNLHEKGMPEAMIPSYGEHFGNPVCGNIVKVFLKIENNVITDPKFKTVGCGAAIVSSRMATELFREKLLEEARNVSNKGVAGAHEDLPPIKMHCSMPAEEKIHNAINDYRKKHGSEPWVEKNPHAYVHGEDLTCDHEPGARTITRKFLVDNAITTRM